MEAFYDMALLSWANPLNPPLPLLSSPTSPYHYKFQDGHPHIASKDLDSAKETAAQAIQTGDYPERVQQDRYDVNDATEKKHNEQGLHEGTKIGKLLAITKHLSAFVSPQFIGTVT